MHSGWLNFSHGKSSIGTRVGQAWTHWRHVPFSHLNGSRLSPMKLNRFIMAIIAPCGQRYLHQLLGTYIANTSTMMSIANCTQNSGDRIEIW